MRDASVIERKVGSLRWIICASPDYLQAHGEPKRPADLAGFNCLIHPKLAPERRWHFEEAGSDRSVKVAGTLASNSVVVLRRAVLAGVGIAMLPLYRVEEDLKKGSLKQVLRDHQLPVRPIYAVYAQTRHVPEKIRLFVEYMASWYARGETYPTAEKQFG